MGILILLLPLVLIFFMMQSQRKKALAQQQLIASLTEGDDVMTTAGMYGTLTWVGKEEAFVEIADGVEIHIAKVAIARKVDISDTEAAKIGNGDGQVDVGDDTDETDDADETDEAAEADEIVLDKLVPEDAADAEADSSPDDADEPSGPVSTPKRRWRGGGK